MTQSNTNDLIHNRQWIKCTTAGDGHCFLYSIGISWFHQISASTVPSYESMKMALFEETVANADKYRHFCNDSESLIHQTSLYLLKKHYNSSYGDMVPSIIANCFSIDLFIINESDTLHVVRIIPDAAEAVLRLVVHRSRDHYSGVYFPYVLQPVPASLPCHDLSYTHTSMTFKKPSSAPTTVASPPLPKITYSTYELRSLQHHALSIPRKVRKCLFQLHVWRPRKSVISSIPVIIDHQSNQDSNLQFGANLDNLKHISCQINKKNKQPSIHLMVYNTRSAMKKPLYINEFIQNKKCDILSMCETWIKPGDDAKVKEMCPDNYTFLGKSRDTRGGGVGLVVNNSIHIKHDKVNSQYDSFEHHSATLHFEHKQVKLVTIYRSPSDNITSGFLEDFEEFLSEVIMFPDSILIVGDFNIHLNKPDQRNVCKFLDILESFDLKQHVQEATHKLGNTIDLVISRNRDNIVESVRVLPQLNFISDHHPVSCILNVAVLDSKEKQITRRQLRGLDTTSFANDLKRLLKIQPQAVTDANALYGNYHTCANLVFDIHAPFKTKSVKIRKPSPWYNNDIHALRQKRRRLERRWCKTKTSEDYEAYENQSIHTVQMIRQAKQTYYREKLMANPREAFQLLNSLLHVNSVHLPTSNSDSEMANKFISFFTEKVSRIRSFLDSGPDIANSDELRHCQHKLTSFVFATEDEVRNTILSAKTKSCKLDVIPTHVIKDKAVLDALTPYLTALVNTSLSSGTMPDAFKMAMIIPHLKKPGLDPENLSNYRPVSNIQFLAKIIERCVASRILNHMSMYSIGDQFQSAYKAAHSTETALLKVKRDCEQALNAGRAVLLVMLDLSAAFDTIDHTLLLDRLNKLVGVEGTALLWLESYVRERYQKVVINNCASSPVPLRVGVPQGSVLGPLLFLVYILPLQYLFQKHGVSYHAYADDTQLYVDFDPSTDGGLSSAISKLENCIVDVSKWMTANRLKLNDEKTEFIIFASQHHYESIIKMNPVIGIGSSIIQPKKVVKNLGAVFDAQLKMADQVKAVTRSMYYHMRGIRNIRHYLDDSTCTKAVMALVITRLDYANSLLAGMSQTSLHKLQVAQNCAARLISKTPPSSHITPVLHQLHWLPVHQRITFKSLCIIYKCIYDSTMPQYISDLFVRYNPARNLRSATNGINLLVNICKNKYGDRSFDTWASKQWNTLPKNLQEAPSFPLFKRLLKTFLFKQYYT